MFVYIKGRLDVFEVKLEGYLTSVNQTGTLTPIILQVKELISVSKGKAVCPLLLPPVWDTERNSWWVTCM